MSSPVSSSDRTIRMLADEVAALKSRINDLERGVRGNQLGDSSIENGYISVYDEAGVERARIGKQDDGTYVGGRSMNSDTPPVIPATPVVVAGFGTLKITAPGPSAGFRWAHDFSHINVYVAGTSYDQTGKVVGKLTATPNTFVLGPLPIEVHRVWLTSVNFSGSESAASEEVAGLPTQVVGQDILDGAVTTLKLAAEAVTAAKIAAGAVGTVQIGDQAVDVTKLADGSVSGQKVIANAIAAGHIAADAIRANHLKAGEIQAGHLAVGAIDTERIAADAVTAAKIVALAITADKIAANAIAAGHIQAGTITGDKIQAGTIISDATIQSGTTGLRVVMDAAGNDIRFYPVADETRWARVFATPLGDDIKLTLQSIDADVSGLTSAFELFPDQLYMAIRETDLETIADVRVGGLNGGSPEVDFFVQDTGTGQVGSLGLTNGFVSLSVGPIGGSAGFTASDTGDATVFTAGSLRARNTANNAYRPMLASAFTVNSSSSVKEGFAEMPNRAIDVLRGAPITRWRRRDDPDARMTVGPIAETLPEWVTWGIRPEFDERRVRVPAVLDAAGNVVTPERHEVRRVPSTMPESESLDLLTWTSVVAQAVRELDEELDDLRRERGRSVPTRRTATELLTELRAGRRPDWSPRSPREA